MHIEKIILNNFRSYGPLGQTIELDPQLTALVGANGAGKTVVMQALQRLFGVSNEQRTIRRQDFHIPLNEATTATERSLSLEVIITFPELGEEDGDHSAIPEFFSQMQIPGTDGQLKCRFRLDAQWFDDGTTDGATETQLRIISTVDKDFKEEDCAAVRPADRSRIQLIYVPATRSATAQVSSFLKGRLWKAINWSAGVKQQFSTKAQELNTVFKGENAVNTVTKKLTARWQELHSAGTYSKPVFRPIDLLFEQFVSKVEVLLHPDESGRDRSISELSDGQSSLFHIAMTAATLDVEAEILAQPVHPDFIGDNLPLPSLTIIALEEPENNLSPHYLSRIIKQINSLADSQRAQAVLSSHSPSILARIEPAQVRHFRLLKAERTTLVKKLFLPKNENGSTDENEAAKYIQQAVRAYPELYFAKFVVLGEGASEEVIIPKIAEAMGISIDRSFVAMVPLGGRHVNHFWRLLSDLDIPYATLLDLDWGRHGGGWGRIKNAIGKKVDFRQIKSSTPDYYDTTNGEQVNFSILDTDHVNYKPNDLKAICQLTDWLQNFGVYFSSSLDIDYSMLKAFPDYYKALLDENANGPSSNSKLDNLGKAVLGDEGNSEYYANDIELLRWYRYLFLGRGKPSTHIRVLNSIPEEVLKEKAPEELKALVRAIQKAVDGEG